MPKTQQQPHGCTRPGARFWLAAGLAAGLQGAALQTTLARASDTGDDPAYPIQQPTQKLTLGLAEIAAAHQAGRRVLTPTTGLVSLASLARIADYSVTIDAVAADSVTELAAELESLGATVTASFGRILSARIPLDQLAALEGVEALQFARPVLAMTHVGSVTSQGDKAQRSDIGRAQLGVDGTGSKVGILSDSFDCSGIGSYATDRASGDLPAGIDIIDDSECTDAIDEGRAMAQIVHDVAPGAKLAFHTAFGGIADFAQGILDLAAADCDVIVDDVIYHAEPMFQDGAIAQAADQVTASGVAFFSSAGNEARQSYEAPFRPSGVDITVGGKTLELHDFDPGAGVDTWQAIAFTEFRQSVGVLQWSEPFFSVSGGTGSRSDLAICASNTPSTVGLLGCVDDDNVGGDPVELIGLNGRGPVYIAIGHRAGPYPTSLKTVWSRNTIASLEHTTNSPTSYGHANAAGAIAVGAAFYRSTPAYLTNPPKLENFSSAGGIPILFDKTGKATNILRAKPEITAPDGANTTFFYPGTDPEPDGFPNFFGTSAAAPHAAGVAALMRDLDPDATPAMIREALEETAVDILARESGAATGSGFDADSGHGLIDAAAALQQIASGGTPYGPQLAVDFGSAGLWHYSGSWKLLSSWNPGTGGIAGWADGLAADFDTQGLWHWTGSSWGKLSAWNAAGLASWSQGLAVDFDGQGLWSWSGTRWRQLSTSNPEALAGWSSGLAADFGAAGLWRHDGTGWQRLSTWNPGNGGMAGWSGGLAVDFDGNGLWNYDGSRWRQLSAWNVGSGGSGGWSGGLAVDFDANGTWSHDGSRWQRLSTWNPGSGGLTGWASSLAIDYDSSGLWSYGTAMWSKLGGNPEAMDAVDLN